MTILTILQCVGFGTLIVLPLACGMRIIHILALRRRILSPNVKRCRLPDVKLLNVPDAKIYIDHHVAKTVVVRVYQVDQAFRAVACMLCPKNGALVNAWVALMGALDHLFQVEAKDE